SVTTPHVPAARAGMALALSRLVASVQGVENAWLRGLAVKRAAALGVYCAVLGGGVISAAVCDARVAVVILIAGIAFARRPRGLVRRYPHATQGAAGELATATMLALLPADFTVVNDLAFERFNVDHVVVGHTGVWVIETKSQAGVVEERANGVWLNGRRTF